MGCSIVPRSLAVALSLVASLPLPSGSLRAAPAEAASRECTGSFQHVGGEADEHARDRAIEDAVGEMNFLVRGIARKRLRAATPIVRAIAVSRDGARTTTVLDGRRYATERDDAPTEVKSPTGDRVTLVHRWRSGVLEQHFRGDEGGRRNVYRCDAETLEVEVRIESSHLPRAVRYRLHYARR